MSLFCKTDDEFTSFARRRNRATERKRLAVVRIDGQEVSDYTDFLRTC